MENFKKIGLGKQFSSVPITVPLNDLNNYFSSSSQNADTNIVNEYIHRLENQNNFAINSFSLLKVRF